jgi:hypothetical protein
MEAVVDDSGNSEIVKCLRYQGLMRWIKEGSRLPLKFHKKDKPPTKNEFLDKFNPIPPLEENPIPFGYDWVKEDPVVRDAVFDAVIPQISLTNTDPVLKQLLVAAGLIPAQAFDGARVLSTAAREALSKRTGIPVDTITSLIRQELDESGSLTPETAQLLSGVGDAARTLLEGVQSGTIDGALINIGQNTLRNALLTLSPKTASVMTGLMSGGVWGAIDTAAILGLNQLPPEVNKYVQPVLGVAKNVLSGYPTALGDILNTASGGGLTAALSSTFNSVIGRNAVTPQLIDSVTGLLGAGSLGPIGQLFNGLGNLAGIPKAPGPLGSLPLLASTAMGSLGLGGSVTSLFGLAGGGLGFGNLATLIGASFNPASAILLGVGALSSLFGGGGGDCPCDPKCRKTEHAVDSDGLKLLDPCGALPSVNANSYSGYNLPIPNNVGEVAETMGLSNTLVGLNLIPSNIRDLTSMISEVDRMKNLAERTYASRYADEPERKAEIAYSFETLEKGLKMADNNITRMESVERKLIDIVYNILQNIFWKPEGAVLEKLITDTRENAKAIRDIYGFVKGLDLAKDGPRIGVNVTPNIAASFKNIPDLASLYKENVLETSKIMNGGVIPADAEWRTMKPGLGFESVLGEYPETIPDMFPDERTLFDEPRILSISLDAKLVDDLQENIAPIDQLLSPSQINSLKDNFIDRQTGRVRPIPEPGGEVVRVETDTPLAEGTVLPPGTTFPLGESLPTGVPLPSGTILPAGTTLPPGVTFSSSVISTDLGESSTGISDEFSGVEGVVSLYDEVKARESGETDCE